MCEAIKCISCGAVSYNDYGKTALHCHKCYEGALADTASQLSKLYAYEACIRGLKEDVFSSLSGQHGLFYVLFFSQSCAITLLYKVHKAMYL